MVVCATTGPQQTHQFVIVVSLKLWADKSIHCHVYGFESWPHALLLQVWWIANKCYTITGRCARIETSQIFVRIFFCWKMVAMIVENWKSIINWKLRINRIAFSWFMKSMWSFRIDLFIVRSPDIAWLKKRSINSQANQPQVFCTFCFFFLYSLIPFLCVLKRYNFHVMQSM